MIDKNLVKYTKHARLQMEKRGIMEEQVLATLNNPDEVKPGSHSHETIAIKRLTEGRVRVIYVSEPDKIMVITVTH